MYLLDSNVFLHIANRAEGAERIERRFIQATAARSVINPVIAAELRSKIETGPGRIRKRSLDMLMELVEAVRCVPIDCAAGQEGGMIFAEQAAKGRSIAMPDALIAGHARRAGLTLVSDNEKHFAGIARLKLENWRA